ncbi:hypothetical protein BH20ACI3_BH20ACI3_00180 [soil metagenome]
MQEITQTIKELLLLLLRVSSWIVSKANLGSVKVPNQNWVITTDRTFLSMIYFELFCFLL